MLQCEVFDQNWICSRATTVAGAGICSAGDSSCLMHIGGGLSRSDPGVKTLHLAQILASTKENPS